MTSCKRRTVFLALSAALWLWRGPCAAPAASPVAAAAEKTPVRLTVFYPSQGTIEDLLALRESGALDIPGLSITGIHHRLEKTDYDGAGEFLREKGIGWMTIRTVDAAVRPQDIFRENAWTAEFKRILDESDGVIFFGGPDIPPSVYGSRQSFHTEVDDLYRHYLEASALFHFLGGSRNPGFRPLLEDRPGFPVLGICLGMQTMNVAAGGTLVQDIWAETYKIKTVEDAVALGPERWHTNPRARLFPRKTVFPYFLHVVRFAAGGKLAGRTGLAPHDRPHVLSAHHQQAGRLGRGLRVEAVSADGRVVEALSHERFPNVLGVQFHPEFDILWTGDALYDITPGDASPMTVRKFLENRPPSMDFHRNLWAWFGAALRASAEAARGGRRAPD
jgi:putative glutamine amidotransferase